MKKLLPLLLVALMVVFAGCGEQKAEKSSKASSKPASSSSELEERETHEPLSTEMQAIADKLDVKEYRCTGLEYEHIVFVVTNKSDTDCALEVAVDFYDKDKKIVDSQDEDLNAIGAGQTSVIAVYANEKFESYTYDFYPSELTRYKAVTQDLELMLEEGDNKFKASVTNNGKIDAINTDINLLYFKDGELIYYDEESIGDDKNVIAPGKTETKDIIAGASLGYDKYETYLTSYGESDS